MEKERDRERDPAVLVKYRPLYRCGDRGHFGKRKSMVTAMTHRSTHSLVCELVCVCMCFNYAYVKSVFVCMQDLR